MADWDVVEERPILTPGNRGGDWDVVEQAPIAAPKRSVGAGEIAARAGKGLTYAASAAAAAPVVGLARIADAVSGLFGGPQDALQRFVGDRFVVPALENVEASLPRPTEDAGAIGGAILEAAPAIGKFIPDIAMGAGLTRGTARVVGDTLPGVINSLRTGAVAGVPAGQRVGQERRVAVEQAGGTPLEAQLAGMASGAGTMAQFALPASAGSAAATLPARTGSRAAQGAAINVPAGAVQRQIENLATPDRLNMEQPVVDPRTAGLDAVLGALFGQMGGRMQRGQPAADAAAQLNAWRDADSATAAAAAELERFRPLLEANGITDMDGAAAMMAINSLRMSEARRAAEAELRATEAQPPMPPEQVPGFLPEGTIYVDSQGRAEARADVETPRGRTIAVPSGEKAGMAAAEGARAAQDVQARQAFDVAERQAQRKQDAQDDASIYDEPRDLREARSGGTTTPEGTAATTPEAFTFLDARIADGQMVRGEQVDVLERDLTVKNEQGKEVPASRIRMPDGSEQIVADRRLMTRERPANPRFSQDVAATSYAPPRGVGTGPEQPQPRRAGQRITTEPSPEFIPAGREAPRGDAPRDPQTYDGQSARVTDPQALPRPALASPEPPQGQLKGPATRDVALPAESWQTSRPTDVEVDADGRAVRAADRRALGRQEPARDVRPAQSDQQQTVVGRPGPDTSSGRTGFASSMVDALQKNVKAQLEQPAKRGKRAVMQDERIGDPDYAAELRRMAESETGWAEVGGRMIRDETDPMRPVTGRTQWIGNSDWWEARPVRFNEAATKEAARKAEAGEPLTVREERLVRFMLDEAQKRVDADRAEAAEGRRELDLGREGRELPDFTDPEDGVTFDIVGRELGQDEADAFFGYKPADKAVQDQGAARGQDDAAPHRGVREGGSASQRPDPAGERASDQPGRDSGPADFSLRGETPDELRARDARERIEAKQQRARDNAPPPDDFNLTGSDRAADEGDARGHGTLFANPIGKVLEWAMGGSMGNLGRSIKDFAGSIRDAAAGPRAPGSALRAVFDTAAGEVGAIVDKSGSKTAKWVYDQFASKAGGTEATAETVHSAATAYSNQRLVQLDRLLKPIIDDKAALAQVVNLVRNSSGIRPGTPVHDAAAGIRRMLNEALKYMRDSGVDVGEVKGGYFPRDYNRIAVTRDPKGFIEAAAKAYRETGMPAKDAPLAAQELHDAIVFGDNSMFGAKGTQTSTPFLKGRVFGKQVDAPTHPLNRFLESDPTMVLVRYFDRVGRRAEVAKRFGDNFENWGELTKKIREEGGGAALQKLEQFAAMGAGMRRHGGDMTMAISSGLRTWGALMFLEKATLSSLTEFIVPAVRSGKFSDIGRSLQRTIADLVQTTKGAERRAFAEDLGLLAGHLAENLQIGRFVGDMPMSRLEQKVMTRYFRRTGLTQWTEATTAAAADMGRIFVRRLAHDTGKLTGRYLSELGVPEAKHAEFSAFVKKFGANLPAAGELTGDMGELYRSAVRRFANQSIMRPDQTLRPRWMSHPVGAVLGQLQSFNYAFFENVIKRNLRLTKDAVSAPGYSMAERGRMMSWLLTFPTIAAAAYAIGEGRDAALGDPDRRKEETQGDKVLKALSRGTPVAPLDPFLNILSGAKYSRSATEALAGPVLGSYGRGIDAFLTLMDDKKNSPNTNTAERNAMKAIYDLAIEPTLNFALTPVAGPLAAAATVGGIPALRDDFVDATAGEKKRRGERYF